MLPKIVFSVQLYFFIVRISIYMIEYPGISATTVPSMRVFPT